MNAIAMQRDPRVQKMIDNPTEYFNEARKAARQEAQAANRRETALRRRLRKSARK